MNRLMLVAVACLLIAGCANQPSSAPLPADLAIVNPDASVPADIRGSSGMWAGKWRGLAGGQQQDTMLVVERIAGNEASVVYSQGAHVRFRSLHLRATAKVENGVLTFSVPLKDGPAVYSYNLQGDGSLDAKMEYRGFKAVSTLKRTTNAL